MRIKITIPMRREPGTVVSATSTSPREVVRAAMREGIVLRQPDPYANNLVDADNRPVRWFVHTEINPNPVYTGKTLSLWMEAPTRSPIRPGDRVATNGDPVLQDGLTGVVQYIDPANHDNPDQRAQYWVKLDKPHLWANSNGTIGFFAENLVRTVGLIQEHAEANEANEADNGTDQRDQT